jgi:hypothetical protein
MEIKTVDVLILEKQKEELKVRIKKPSKYELISSKYMTSTLQDHLRPKTVNRFVTKGID